jgi:hypothetical protein
VVDYLTEHPHLPRLIQRAALDDSRYLRSTLGRTLRPLYAQGLGFISQATGSWRKEERLHVAAGLYQLIFGYFSNASLFEIVTHEHLLTPVAIERQRHFLRTAVAQLLGRHEAQPAGRRKDNRKQRRPQ